MNGESAGSTDDESTGRKYARRRRHWYAQSTKASGIASAGFLERVQYSRLDSIAEVVAAVYNVDVLWWFEREGRRTTIEVLNLPTGDYELRLVDADGAEQVERFTNSAALAKRQQSVQDTLIARGAFWRVVVVSVDGGTTSGLNAPISESDTFSLMSRWRLTAPTESTSPSRSGYPFRAILAVRGQFAVVFNATAYPATTRYRPVRAFTS